MYHLAEVVREHTYSIQATAGHWNEHNNVRAYLFQRRFGRCTECYEFFTVAVSDLVPYIRRTGSLKGLNVQVLTRPLIALLGSSVFHVTSLRSIVHAASCIWNKVACLNRQYVYQRACSLNRNSANAGDRLSGFTEPFITNVTLDDFPLNDIDSHVPGSIYSPTCCWHVSIFSLMGGG